MTELTVSELADRSETLRRLECDIAFCRQAVLPALAASLEKTAAELRRLEAENKQSQARIMELGEKLKVPHPARDMVNEFNDLLKAKQVHIEELEQELAAKTE